MPFEYSAQRRPPAYSKEPVPNPARIPLPAPTGLAVRPARLRKSGRSHETAHLRIQATRAFSKLPDISGCRANRRGDCRAPDLKASGARIPQSPARMQSRCGCHSHREFRAPVYASTRPSATCATSTQMQSNCPAGSVGTTP